MLEKINWKGVAEVATGVASKSAEAAKADAHMKGVMILGLLGFFVIQDIGMEISARRRHKERMELEALRHNK